MAKYVPFDLEVYEVVAMEPLNTFQRGIVRIIVEYFWKTGMDVSSDDFRCSMVLQMNLGTWKRIKHVVLPAINVIMNPLFDKRIKRIQGKDIQVKNAAKARMKQKRNRMQNVTALSDSEDLHTQFTPIPSNQIWNEGKHDTHAKSAAKAATLAGEPPKFRDK